MIIIESWFLYYSYDSDYTNKCQLVTVLWLLLLPSSQVHSCQPQAMDSAQTDTREKAAHVLTPCTSILGFS